ncbi:MAG TPA: PilT/PilU family type 4a pilus ATPase [Holophaga sp.]|jgi:twitching motility protein PilT|nr:PilT/PilU family type 4a pilus ATPase [Holophaga sp.]
MAQLDKLLVHAASRGAMSLRLETGQKPTMELPTGSQPLLAQAVPATMMELLAREVIPTSAQAGWLSSGEARFEYEAGDQHFQISIERTPQGICIDAQPLSDPRRSDTAITLNIPVEPPPLPPSIPSPSIPAPSAEAPSAMSADPMTTRPQIQATQDPEGAALAHRLFQALLDHQGSDLHVSAFETPIVRVHGDLQDLGDFGILGPNQILAVMEAIATPIAWEHFRECHDADFAYNFEQGNCRLRVNFFEDRVGPGLVCRVIPNQIPDPDKLGLADPIRQLAYLSKGLVLVTGPTGSGKSTTLAAILDLANQNRSDHILTIEDPIEFVHPRKRCLVNQREVGTHTESFKSGLRAALREDPDIVLVGEMRDLETIAIALETAITGHLVFGTLHTNSAVGTIDRIVDQFPSDRQSQIRVMLADSLKASISQILLKKSSGGRVAAIESLFVTPAIANLIREGKNFQIPSSMQTGRAYGQKLMNDALLELIQSGTVDHMEAYTKCPDKESFMATLKRNNIAWDPRGETLNRP